MLGIHKKPREAMAQGHEQGLIVATAAVIGAAYRVPRYTASFRETATVAVWVELGSAAAGTNPRPVGIDRRTRGVRLRAVGGLERLPDGEVAVDDGFPVPGLITRRS
jgi:hypothetical protein